MEFSCPDNYPVYCNWYNDRNYAKRYFSCVKNREQCGYPHKGLFGDQKPYRRMCGKGEGFGGDRCTESLEEADLIPEPEEVEGGGKGKANARSGARAVIRGATAATTTERAV